MIFSTVQNINRAANSTRLVIYFWHPRNARRITINTQCKLEQTSLKSRSVAALFFPTARKILTIKATPFYLHIPEFWQNLRHCTAKKIEIPPQIPALSSYLHARMHSYFIHEEEEEQHRGVTRVIHENSRTSGAGNSKSRVRCSATRAWYCQAINRRYINRI